jgi:hypothetical protein
VHFEKALDFLMFSRASATILQRYFYHFDAVCIGKTPAVLQSEAEPEDDLDVQCLPRKSVVVSRALNMNFLIARSSFDRRSSTAVR